MMSVMCIESGRTPSQDYPQQRFMGRVRRETHVIWFRAHGRFPAGFLCHTCDNRRCIDLDHLFEGSNSANQLDAVEKGRHASTRKTHCPSGHEYSETNTYRRPSRPTERQCRICLDLSARAAQARAR